MRVFVAIEFNNDIKQHLYDAQQEIIKFCSKGNFTRKDNFHITLKFIGEIRENDIHKIKECIDATASEYKPFKLTVQGIGQFPKGNRKIIWIGVKKSEELAILQKHLENCLDSKGFKKEDKNYNPHITLGREVVVDSKNGYEGIKIKEADINVNKISLMESKRVEGLLTYVPIYVKEIK